MPVFTLHNFDDAGTIATDSALANGDQHGAYFNGAVATAGQAVLDGVDDFVKIFPDPAFQLNSGTLNIQFTLSAIPQTGTQTVLSRDSVGLTEGGYHIDILQDGSIVVSHETATGTETFGTAPGYAAPGDEINLSYSWDLGGTGGTLIINNLTSGTSYAESIPNTLTMDQGGISQPWVIGAGQSASDPGAVNNIDQNFAGSVAVFSVSDSVDNQADASLVANPDTATTPEDTPVTIAVLANDTDPQDQPLAVTAASALHGVVVINPNGTLTYTPNLDYNGPDTISYTVTDPDGNSASTTVAVTVIPDSAGPDGFVTGTAAGDLIDLAYIDPFDTDRVDAGDALLAGDAPDDDRILAGAGHDTVDAGTGDDSVEAGTGNDLVSGRGGDDTLIGDAGDDQLLGQAGNDVLYGGDGADDARGGAGNDYIDTSGGSPLPFPDQDYPGQYAADPNPANDLDTVYGGAGDDSIRTGDDADLAYGGYGNDSLDGGVDNDRLYGDDGDDTIIGAGGADVIDAGLGADLVYGGYGPGVPDTVNIRDDLGDLRPENGNDSLLGGAGNDTIFGMDDNDTIDGGLDHDLIDGGIDQDIITGNTGNDTIIGGQGADTASGGDDRDTFLITAQTDGFGDVIDGNEGGDDFDTLDLRCVGQHRIHYAADNPENGVVNFLDAAGNYTGSLAFSNIENVIPCFTPGTLIATPKGEVLVEDLKVGDRIITRDNGLQDIRWIGTKTMGYRELFNNPHLKPVLIRQGSLGNGLPERDMMVSPNHRLLVANDRTALYFDEHEVLVAAKHLVAVKGVSSIDSVGTTYIHFMFDRHEVVLANGAWTESFQPGDYTLKGMGNAQRTEIFDLFPELKTVVGLEGYQAARRTLKRHEALLLVR